MMWLALKLFLTSTFSSLRAWLYLIGSAAVLASYVYVFFSGVSYNEAKHAAASAKFQAEFNKQQYDDLFSVANESAVATEAFQKVEAVNDTIEESLLQPLTPSDGCLDAGWLRNLDKLH